jgi:hypothetical protein
MAEKIINKSGVMEKEIISGLLHITGARVVGLSVQLAFQNPRSF